MMKLIDIIEEMEPPRLFVYIFIFFCICGVGSAWMVADIATVRSEAYRQIIKQQDRQLDDLYTKRQNEQNRKKVFGPTTDVEALRADRRMAI